MTAIWGWTFVIVKTAISHYPTLPFLGLRFALSLLVMAFVVRRLPSARTARVGALLGLALAAGYLFQTVGLSYTTPANAGLLTGLFVVFTPILERAFGRPIHVRTAVAVVVALLGTMLLSGVGTASVAPLGDLLEVLCALSFALHIVLLSRWSPGLPPASLALVQMATAALVFNIAGVPALRLQAPADVWFAIVITGVFASAVAFFIQTWAQAKLSASRTALILATEPAWALLFGVLLAGQRFGPIEAVGAALILFAILGHEIAHVRSVRLAAAQ